LAHPIPHHHPPACNRVKVALHRRSPSRDPQPSPRGRGGKMAAQQQRSSSTAATHGNQKEQSARVASQPGL
jgi:hypothetical protein